MARVSGIHSTPTGAPNWKDSLLELDRLLSRLDHNILHASADKERRLRRDEFERTKARYDIDAARRLLTRLEQDALAIKIHSRRQEVQTDLYRKQELIAQLQERVQDLEDMGVDDDDDSSSEGEDILADILQTPSESMDSRSTGPATEDALPDEEEERIPPIPKQHLPTDRQPVSEEKASREPANTPPTTTTPVAERPETTLTHTAVRARGKQHQPHAAESAAAAAADTAQTTSAKLFEGRTPTRTATTATVTTEPSALSATATEEALLDSQRREQEALSEDILRMARALKDKTLATARLLEEDKDVVGTVGDGLDSTDAGMASAGRQMGVLRRMTEGKAGGAACCCSPWSTA